MRPAELADAELTPGQRMVLERLGASNLAGAYYLSGGTALAAFYLRHRRSEDLDLFTNDEVPLDSVESFLQELPETTIQTFQRLYDRRLFLLLVDGEPLKVEFTRFPFQHRQAPTTLVGGLRTDTLVDIFLNKLHAMTDRKEPKDDVDVYFLMDTGYVPPIAEAVELAEQKFGVRGLRYILQRRLLAVPNELPPTSPPVSRDVVVERFREVVEEMVRRSAE